MKFLTCQTHAFKMGFSVIKEKELYYDNKKKIETLKIFCFLNKDLKKKRRIR